MMTRLMTSKVFGAVGGALVLSMIAFACSSSSGGGTSADVDSGGDNDTAAADDGGGSAATTVPCPIGKNPNATCNAATHYCITTGAVLDGGFYRSTAGCFPLPAGCDACNCIDAGGAWSSQSIGDNCKTDPDGPVVISCTDDNGAISATCTKTLP